MSDTLVSAVIGGFIALAAGALGLLGKAVFDRRTESHTSRRLLYVELLTLLVSRREYMNAVIWHQDTTSTNVPSEKVDRLNALLSIDASEAVATLAPACFELLNRFGVSRAAGAPVERGEHGLYNYRFDRVRDQPEETRNMVMRLALGGILDEYNAAFDVLAAQVRREVHRAF